MINLRGGSWSILALGFVQLHAGSSFLLSSMASKRPRPASRCLRTIAWAEANEAGAGQTATSPAGLALEGVYKRLKLETQGLADGVVGLESKDTDFGVSVENGVLFMHIGGVVRQPEGKLVGARRALSHVLLCFISR